MNTFHFDASWNQIKGKLRQRFAQLTDDDVEFAEGKGEELIGRLQSKLGMARDNINDLLNEMKSEAAPMRFKVDQAKAKVGEVTEDLRSRMSNAAGELKSEAAVRAERAYNQA
ncbi:MAG TPA: CsbD family protein, partial [Chthoniobacteraceae bacterium]|nr:CsbD family protein [Chthoniobacteraceae bacterium]